jgi:zinc resistance-associated protein
MLTSKRVLKSVTVAAVAMAIIGSSIVYAQEGFGGRGEDRYDSPWLERHRPSVDDLKALTDARIAALKAGLQLTPEQETNWGPFEQALRELAQLRIWRIQAREADRTEAGAAPFERLARWADALSKRSTALKHLAAAGGPLFQSLNDEQKRRFKLLSHILRPHPHFGGGAEEGNDREDHEGGWREDREGGWHGQGFGREDNGPGDSMDRTTGDDE